MKTARLLILALAGIAAATAVLVGGLAISRSSETTREQANARMQEIVARNVLRVEQRIDRVTRFAAYLATSAAEGFELERARADPGYRHAIEAGLLLRFQQGMQATAAPSAWVHFDPAVIGGVIHASLFVGQGEIQRTPRFDIRATGNASDDWFAAVIERGALAHWTTPYFWPKWNATVVSHSRRVESNGVTLGVAGSEIFMDDLFREFNAVQVYRTGGVLLMNQDLQLIYPANIEEADLSALFGGALRSAMPQLLDIGQAAGTVQYSRDGGERLLAYQRLSNGWLVAVEAGISEVYEEHDSLILEIVLLTASGLLLSLLLAYAVGTRISRQINQLGLELEASNKLLTVRNRQVNEKARELERLAHCDALTGQANRRVGILYLSKMIDLCKRQRRPLCIGFVDINDLKRVNDEFGHREGDRLIRHVTALLAEQVRESDVVARLGGDELLVILVDCTAADAERTFAAVQQRIDQQSGGFPFPISFSVGIRQYPTAASGMDAHEFINEADAQMYTNKQVWKRQHASGRPEQSATQARTETTGHSG